MTADTEQYPSVVAGLQQAALGVCRTHFGQVASSAVRVRVEDSAIVGSLAFEVSALADPARLEQQRCDMSSVLGRHLARLVAVAAAVVQEGQLVGLVPDQVALPAHLLRLFDVAGLVVLLDLAGTAFLEGTAPCASVDRMAWLQTPSVAQIQREDRDVDAVLAASVHVRLVCSVDPDLLALDSVVWNLPALGVQHVIGESLPYMQPDWDPVVPREDQSAAEE